MVLCKKFTILGFSWSLDRPSWMIRAMRYIQHATLVLVACQLVCRTCAEYLLHTFTQHVGGGNFTYYKLSRPGNVKLVLDSLSGDADMYVSDSTLMPDYENYDSKSATFGEDIVVIPADMNRPVGVAIYGHPGSISSQFILKVYVDEKLTGESEMSERSTHRRGGSYFVDGKDDEEPVLWTIFVGILKILFDILIG